jgi:hypothetical protein
MKAVFVMLVMLVVIVALASTTVGLRWSSHEDSPFR